MTSRKKKGAKKTLRQLTKSVRDLVASYLGELEQTAPRDQDLNQLTTVWDAVAELDTQPPVNLYRVLSERILSIGEPFLAYDVCSKGLQNQPEDLRLLQLKALALARSGACEEASSIVYRLYRQGHQDGETLGILGRTFKDMAAAATAEDDAAKLLGRAERYYDIAFRQAEKNQVCDDAIYTGINVAALSVLRGHPRRAKNYARKVHDIAVNKLKTDPHNYWALASLGEASLILGELNEAEDYYLRAGRAAPGRAADLCSTRKQAHELLAHTQRPTSLFDHCFPIPTVIVFAGHMIDQPGRPNHRFPKELEPYVRAAVSSALKRHDAKIGYSSAACGSDILFLEEIIRQQGEANIVLPLPQDEFCRASVDIIPDTNWDNRYQKLLEKAAGITVASRDRSTGNRLTYEHANRLLHGLARLRAQTLDTDLVPLAVWDGKPGDGPSGTQSMIDQWQQDGLNPNIIQLDRLRRDAEIKVSRKRGSKKDRPSFYIAEEDPKYPRKIMAMVFADVRGYSDLQDEQVRDFVEHFMGTVAELLDAGGRRPLRRKTWGDAFYLVFDDILAAGRFAARVCHETNSIDWSRYGLPEELQMRFALHAGPVYECLDPVVGEIMYTGTHVNRAARIEPVVPPGEVYVSQAFAALAMQQHDNDLRFDYVGNIPLAKNFGNFPTYHMQFKSE